MKLLLITLALVLGLPGCSDVQSAQIESVVVSEGVRRGITVEAPTCYWCTNHFCMCQFLYNKQLYKTECYEDSCKAFELSVSD